MVALADADFTTTINLCANPMNILINSNSNYYQKTLLPLLNSLSSSGVPSNLITVVIGAVTGSIDTSSFDVNIETVPYNAIDFNTTIWQSQQDIIPDFIFYLQDTTTVGKNFWNIVKDTKEMKRIYPLSNMNMGVYPANAFTFYDYVYSYYKIETNIDKLKHRAINDEDFIFAQHGCYKAFGNRVEYLDNVDFYKTGQLRRVEYYTDTEITKYRANYVGQPIITRV